MRVMFDFLVLAPEDIYLMLKHLDGISKKKKKMIRESLVQKEKQHKRIVS